ncbi:MAG: 1-acyl-sn-glycerol-3-phosphate acyltransferase [Clostridiales bacterium]|nr:1-acyl-sn-glycerol-3-phosphate acyltransferase [Clostridiales bacterium]
MFLEFFRLLGTITGYPAQIIMFKRRTFYETKRRKDTFKGGKLIVSNHISQLDYVMTSFIVFPRKLNAIVAETAFENKFFNWGMKFFGMIKADRINKTLGFISEGANVLKKGQLLQIFPEGHNSHDGKIHEFSRSYIAIAHRAGVPIVPVVFDGNYGLFKRASVIIGDEINVTDFFSKDRKNPTRDELAKAHEYVYNKVLELREELEVRKQNGNKEAK